MGETRNSVNTPAKEIVLLKKRLDRARAALLRVQDGKKETKLRREMNDIADRLGWLLTDEERYDEALAVYKTVDPKTHGEERFIGISRILIESERFDEALKVLEEALEKYPESYGLLNTRGMLHYKTDDPYEALRWFDRARRHDPGDEEHTAIHNRGLALIDLELFEDAAKVYEGLLEDDAENTAFLYEYGYCNLQRENLWDAIRLFRACLNLGLETPGVYTGLCAAFAKAGLLAEAGVTGINGLHKYPEMEVMYEALGDVYTDMGRFSEAEEVLRRGLEKFPDSEALQELLDKLEQEREKTENESGGEEEPLGGKAQPGEGREAPETLDESLRKLVDGDGRTWN